MEANFVVFIIGLRYHKNLVVSTGLQDVLTTDKKIRILKPRFLN